MDDIAEKGFAAHWIYKQHGTMGEGDYEMDAWLDRIKEILSNPDVNAVELLDMVHNDLTTSDIYVFTPKGEQRSLPKGSTALDFAYAIHTEIGSKAIAAKVNQHLVPLNAVLNTGDKVEIITAQDGKPQPEWLKFLVTHRARTVVADYFKTQRKQACDYGRNSLENALQALGYEADESTLQRLDAAYNVGTREELYYAIGVGQVNLDKLSEVMKRSTGGKLSWIRKMFHSESREEEKPADNTFVIGSSDPNAPHFSIATCCKPIPGDPVIGIKAPDGTVTVHKKTCPVADRIAAQHGDWVVVPKWLEQAEDSSFPVRITLKGLDRVGMLNEITRRVSLVMGVNMRRLNLSADDGLFEGYIDLYVNSRDILDKMIKKLSSIEGIENVSRSEL